MTGTSLAKYKDASTCTSTRKEKIVLVPSSVPDPNPLVYVTLGVSVSVTFCF